MYLFLIISTAAARGPFRN